VWLRRDTFLCFSKEKYPKERDSLQRSEKLIMNKKTGLFFNNPVFEENAVKRYC
jgi:hypothetical protein